MSHELRTPLNAIIGFSEMMQAQVFGELGSPKYVEYCSHIHQGGRYLLDVLTDILDMSRLEAGRVRLEEREVDVSGAVRATVERHAARRDKRITLSVDARDGLRCYGDHDAIVKVDRRARVQQPEIHPRRRPRARARAAARIAPSPSSSRTPAAA